MGARLRLKTSVAGVDPALRTSDPNMRKVFRAMQKHGLIVADNGSDMFITGTFDTRWNNNILNPAFSLLSASDFDVIALGWNPAAALPALASIGASPDAVIGPSVATGTVALAAAAPAGGAVVALSSASAAVSLPGNVTVGPGLVSATFDISAAAVTQKTATTLSATYNGVTRTTTFLVNPLTLAAPALAALTLDPVSVTAGATALATVALSAPAPVAGTVVTLSSSNPLFASVPASVVVPAGARSMSFRVATAAVRRTSTATIVASLAGVSLSSTITVKPAAGGKPRSASAPAPAGTPIARTSRFAGECAACPGPTSRSSQARSS